MPLPRRPSSLSRSTLLQMGARIAGVVALATLFSYLHVLQSVRAENLARLERYVVERSQREQGIFVLAQDNHAVLRQALEERLGALSEEEVGTRFDTLFVQLPDGSVRNRPERFDGTRMPGLIVPKGIPLEAGLRRRILASYDVLAQYGPALHTRFTNTYVLLPDDVLVLYWPERPTWTQEAASDMSFLGLEFYELSLPGKNPRRETVWCGIYSDPVDRSWMVSVSTPLDVDGRHVATIGHDVLIHELMTRTINDHLPGAYNLLFRDDGQLIAHPQFTREGNTGLYYLPGSAGQNKADAPRIPEEQQRDLRSIFEHVRHGPSGQTVTELPEHDEYIGVSRLKGPGWNFVTVLPERVVSQPALQAARQVLLVGIIALVAELAIMSWVLRRQVTRPLLAFSQAAERVAAGDFHVELDTSREDELGQLARAIRSMADKVQHREEALRQANEHLEQRVEERTRELQDVHARLVQTARRAGMAEVATNVLHNVGNVLNSVYTAAQLARERMGRMRLEQVGRVANMLQEHQADAGTFLTQDERGRHVTPFLSKLGESLMSERKELLSLLEDVGRYTEHIGDIVKVQQNYARTPRMHEPVHLEELLEDALRINAAGLSRQGARVERHLTALPPMLTDKHKLLMILVNLISNASHALERATTGERRLIVKLERDPGDYIRIEVRDTGMGISREMLRRIFQYGFTTREDGHGFGLHSSALAAQELGGSLKVHSEGPGHGATFTLEIPCPLAEAPGDAA
ncbi:histidine kinase/DNA gyrase B/HSP90-like ATPase [Archangium gephyra]|uniref:histidine kinase n=1 Tax=Archangium gephyra TaxID=48 RepID=A0AAC8QII3_9BACT|nr:ATP-binding protein [Archangium gephyra]AKJ07656.1 sensor histidine kinase [Archangium gephyra]REG29412.1 histidine kinase/DNA gyrase B/HSP90-like ATPase [Archangium gephyra]